VERLKRLFKYISIRRSKTILDLPRKTDLVRYLSFDSDELAAYKALEDPIATMIDENLRSDNQRANHYMKALAKINLLRRFCNFGSSLQGFEFSNSCAGSAARSEEIYVRDLFEDILSSGQSICLSCNSTINAMQTDMAGEERLPTGLGAPVSFAVYVIVRV
jgi:hypothetical protein